MYVGRIGLQYVIYKGWNKHKGDLSYIMVMSTETFESNVQIFMCGVCVCVLLTFPGYAVWSGYSRKQSISSFKYHIARFVSQVCIT